MFWLQSFWYTLWASGLKRQPCLIFRYEWEKICLNYLIAYIPEKEGFTYVKQIREVKKRRKSLNRTNNKFIHANTFNEMERNTIAIHFLYNQYFAGKR